MPGLLQEIPSAYIDENDAPLIEIEAGLSRSTWVHFSFGVSQGSVRVPLLYIIIVRC